MISIESESFAEEFRNGVICGRFANLLEVSRCIEPILGEILAYKSPRIVNRVDNGSRIPQSARRLVAVEVRRIPLKVLSIPLEGLTESNGVL